MLLVSAAGELGEIGIALIFENVDEADAGGVEGVDGHFLDELEMRRELIGRGDVFEIDGVQPQRGGAPVVLSFGSKFGGGVDNEVDEGGDMGFACAGSIVCGDENFGEGCEKLEVFGREEFGAIIGPIVGIGGRGGVEMLLVRVQPRSYGGGAEDQPIGIAACHFAVQPPSMRMSVPVMKLAESEQRNVARLPISSTLPQQPTGMLATN